MTRMLRRFHSAPLSTRLFLLTAAAALVSGCDSGTAGGATDPPTAADTRWDSGLPPDSSLADAAPPDDGVTDTLAPGTSDSAPADTGVSPVDGGGCPPGFRGCEGPSTRKVCPTGGGRWQRLTCGAGRVCQDGACVARVCAPGVTLGCDSARARRVCNPAGTEVRLEYCSVEHPTCSDGACTDLACTPGTTACLGLGAVQACRADGSAWDTVETCASGTVCKAAQCLSACEANLKENTYLGCDTFATDLDNVEGGKEQNVAVVVSNPSDTKSLTVSIHDTAADALLELTETTVGPLAQRVFLLPKGKDLEGSGLTRRSFRVRTTSPATVHQFNPLNATAVFSNDASLLLPAHVGGQTYLVLGWPQRGAIPALGSAPFRGFAAVVATQAGETVVTVRATANVAAGPGVDAIAAGGEAVFTLSQGDVLNLETAGDAFGPDLTGTRITATRRIAVMAGHECANVPLVVGSDGYGGVDYCDHLEQQLLPLETWGTEVIFVPRAPGQPDVWRILSGAPGVTVTTDPPQPGAQGVVLDEGDWVEVVSAEPFRVVGTGSIAVGHYLVGSQYPGFLPEPGCAEGTGIGDPAFTLPAAVSQLRTEHIVLTPAGYARDYLNVTHTSDATLTLDGVPLEGEALPVGASEWVVTRIAVSPGVHRVVGSSRIAVTAYGYACNVSYAYPGGLELAPQTLSP